MLYRKAPPAPPRLLLRIVATAGAGALLGFTGCSSSSGSPVDSGSVVGPEAGLMANVPSDASDDSAPTVNSSSGGIIVMPDDDASPADAEAGLDGSSPDAFDGSGDATGPCHPCGVVVRPDE
jgi:hypothetical protein